MNNIRSTAKINAIELELGGKGSWHDEFKGSAYVYVGGLDPGLTEGDVITIFSQYGEPVDINLPRDKSTSKPRGFGFLMYEDQRSTNLAVDNLNGAVVLGRTLRVDHVKNYKQLEMGEDGKMKERDASKGESLNARPELHMPKPGSDDDDDDGSEAESYGSIDPEDPMASYLLEERRKAKRAAKEGGKKKRKHEGESKEERRRRKDAKKLKKLLKEVGPPAKRIEEGRRGDEDDDSRRRDVRRSRSPPARRRPDVDDDRYRPDDRPRYHDDRPRYPDERRPRYREDDRPRQRDGDSRRYDDERRER